MKNIYLILITLFLLSCGGGSENAGLPDITITTKSSEAKEAYLKALDLFDLRRQSTNEERKSLLNKAITLDPDFLLAKATLYSFTGTDYNNKILKEVYDERENVSDMEAKIIEFFYNDRTNRDREVSTYNISMLTEEYPELWRLWYWAGLVKSNNPSLIYDAIDDLETALEINPNHFGTKLMLIAKHLQFGGLGNLLPNDEIDLEYLKTMIDDVELNHSDNAYTHVVVGNYHRTLGDFDNALISYKKLEGFQDQGIFNLYTANHYAALANTFKGDFGQAESFFRKNVELGNQFNAYTWLPQMFLFNNDFKSAIDVLGEFEDNLISMEYPAQQELNQVVNINRLKFICHAHNKDKDESLKHIELLKDAQINSINLRKNRLTQIEYNNQVDFANYTNETYLIWHDILFGNYQDASSKLKIYEKTSKSIDRPDNLHNFYVLNAMLELKMNNPEKSIEFFNKTNKFYGFGDQIPLNDDYYTYYKGLALKSSGDIEGSKKLFEEISSKNFYGIQPALVRNLAIAEL